MQDKPYVYRDYAHKQSSKGSWGKGAIAICVFLSIIVVLIINKIPEQEAPVEAIFLSWFACVLGMMSLYLGYHGFRSFFRALFRHSGPAKEQAYWKLDHHWSEEGTIYSSKKKLVFHYLKAAFFFLFLSPFICLVFVLDPDNTEFWVKIVVGIFVLSIGLTLYSLRITWLYHYKYGNSRLVWDQLPLQPGIPFSLELINPNLMEKHPSLEMSIRYIREVWVTSGSGKNRRSERKFVALQDYRQRCEVKDGRLLISATLPHDAPSNAMESSDTRYWELVVHNTKDLLWHPYLAWFYLPVYALEEKEEKVPA